MFKYKTDDIVRNPELSDYTFRVVERELDDGKPDYLIVNDEGCTWAREDELILVKSAKE